MSGVLVGCRGSLCAAAAMHTVAAGAGVGATGAGSTIAVVGDLSASSFSSSAEKTWASCTDGSRNSVA